METAVAIAIKDALVGSPPVILISVLIIAWIGLRVYQEAALLVSRGGTHALYSESIEKLIDAHGETTITQKQMMSAMQAISTDLRAVTHELARASNINDKIFEKLSLLDKQQALILHRRGE